MLSDIIAQLAAPDPEARNGAARNILSKATYRLVSLETLAEHPAFLRNALHWFESPEVEWGDATCGLLRLLTEVFAHPGARRTALTFGALHSLQCVRSYPTTPPDAVPLLDATVAALERPPTPGASPASWPRPTQPEGPLRPPPDVPTPPPPTAVAAASASSSPRSSRSSEGSPGWGRHPGAGQLVACPTLSEATDSPLSRSDGPRDLPPSQLPVWVTIHERAHAKLRAGRSHPSDPILFDVAVRLRHTDPAVVRDACIFLRSALTAGLPVVSCLLEARLALAVADVAFAAAVRLRGADPRHALHHCWVFEGAVDALFSVAVRLRDPTDPPNPDSVRLRLSACVLLMERCVCSLQSLHGAAALGSVALTLLPILAAALKTTTPLARGVGPPHSLTPEEAEGLRDALRVMATEALSRLTVLLNVSCVDPLTGLTHRHLLPSPSQSDNQHLPPDTPAGMPSSSLPSSVPSPPPTPLSIALSSPAGSPAPDSVGWRHPPACLWLRIAIDLLRLAGPSAAHDLSLGRQLLQALASHPSIVALRTYFPELYTELLGTFAGSPCAAAEDNQTNKEARHRYTTEQLAGLGEANHPLDFLAALDSLRTLAAMQPAALATALEPSGTLGRSLPKYFTRPPANRADRLALRQLLLFCTSLLEQSIVSRVDLEFLTAVLLHHLVPHLLLPYQPSTHAADSGRWCPLAEAGLALTVALLRVLHAAGLAAEIRAILSDDALWHHLTILLAETLEAAGGADDAAAVASVPLQGLLPALLHTLATSASLAETPESCGRYRVALIAVCDAVGHSARLLSLHPSDPNHSGVPTEVSLPTTASVLLTSLRTGLLTHCLVALGTLTDLYHRMRRPWADMVSIQFLGWLHSSPEPSHRAAFFDLLADACVDGPQALLVQRALPQSISHALAALASRPPTPTAPAALRFLVSLLEIAPTEDSLLTPGQSAEVVDYVWDALGAESRGSLLIASPPRRLLLRSALTLEPLPIRRRLDSQSALNVLLPLTDTAALAGHRAATPHERSVALEELGTLWPLIDRLRADTSAAPLITDPSDHLLPRLASSLAVLVPAKRQGGAPQAVSPTVPLVLRMLDGLLHPEGTEATAEITGVLAVGGPSLFGALRPTGTVLLEALHGAIVCGADPSVPLAGHAATLVTAVVRLAQDPGALLTCPSNDPLQRPVGERLFRAITREWEEQEGAGTSDNQLMEALHAALCALLLHDPSAKHAAQSGDWGKKMLRELCSVPDMLRLAHLQPDAGRLRGETDAAWEQLEGRLLIATAQLSALAANCPAAQRFCCSEGFPKAVTTVLSLLPYRKAVVLREDTHQSRVVCALLSLVTTLCVGCPEAQTLMAADPTRQNKGLLACLLGTVLLTIPKGHLDPKPLTARDPTPQDMRGVVVQLRGDTPDCPLNAAVFSQLLEAIGAVMYGQGAGVAAVVRSPVLKHLARWMGSWLVRRPAPNIGRLGPALLFLTALSFQERGRASILQTPDLLPAILQSSALKAPGSAREAELPALREAALLVVRNLSYFSPTKVQVANERSLDTLACIVKALRDSGPLEQQLAADALLVLVHNHSKARAIVKHHDSWHTQLTDVLQSLQRPNGGASRQRAAGCLRTVLEMLA